jgi:acyl dehydratase
MSETALAPYRVTARNTAIASENKIHDDAVARRFGFAGGLVPGVEVYAYMTHVPVERWGRVWLERGKAECRFIKPIYDGGRVTVTGEIADGGLDIAVETEAGVCAAGRAGIPAGATAPPSLDGFEQTFPPATRPAADERTLAPGTRLGIAPFRASAEFSARYLADVGETHPVYAGEGLCHPGILLRLCNWALTQNVVLGPWIHAASKVQNFTAARVGDELTVRAAVSANYERKGHQMVDLDALILANARTLVARIEHTAIWRPRQSPSHTT